MDLISLNKDRKRKTVDMSTMVYGKVPPQARGLEEWVLGACMTEMRVIDTVIGILKQECFYVEAHQMIFSAMMALQGRGLVVDLRSVVEELKRMELLDSVGGPYYIAKLTNDVTHTAAVEQHCRIILEKFFAREVIRISGEAIGESYEDSTDVFNMLDRYEASVLGITAPYIKNDFQTAQQAVAKAVERVDNLRKSDRDLSGVPSGFKALDRVTYGWQPTDLIILAARPAVGKTAFALNMARNAALHAVSPVPVGFFSLEMSTSQLIMRLLAAESETPLENITRGKLDDRQYTKFLGQGVRKLESAPIYIDDTAALNVMQFRAKARRLVNKHNVGLIIIDYLQLMSGTGDRGSNREQEISNISRNLKALAKELNVPIIALSQLSRAVETRKESKMPQLSDLRESGAIEQDADMVMFIYRPEYYETTVEQVENSEHTGETHIRIAKHRNGSLDTIKLKARLDIQKFEDWDGDHNFPASWKRVPGADFTQPRRDNFDEGWDTKQPF